MTSFFLQRMTLKKGRHVVRFKDVLVGFITHYSRVYNIGYGKINKKKGAKKT